MIEKRSRYFTYIQPVFRAPSVKTYGAPILTIITMTIFILFAISEGVKVLLPIACIIFNLYPLDFNKDTAVTIPFCIPLG